MESRRANLQNEQVQLRDLGTQQLEQNRRRQRDLANEVAQLDSEVKLAEARTKSARDEAERYKSLSKDKFVSDAYAKGKLDDI